MSYVVGIILFAALAPQALAEPNTPKHQVYSEHSQLTVDNFNKAVGVIRDPTQMSQSFRQAIKAIVPEAQANVPGAAASGGKTLPLVELAGKVLTLNNPAAVVLRIDNRSYHLPEGGSTSMIHDDKMLTVRVDEITEQYVKVVLVELNKPMILQ
ncbi:MAG: hypothetical protein ACU83N_14790 [Gammaproteobacteria bacterium]